MDVGQPQSGRDISPGDEGTDIPLGSYTSESFDPNDDDPQPVDNKSPGLWEKFKRLIVSYVLQLDGSPHSIALGVFIGFVIGMTPTIGIQMVSYFAIAALTGANRVSGLLPVWLSNPVTAVPLYYFNWRVGVFVMTGQLGGSGASQDELAELLKNAPGQDLPLWERLMSADFWQMLVDLFVALGVELWVGCIVVGLVCGVFGYWATLEGVKAYRRQQQAAE